MKYKFPSTFGKALRYLTLSNFPILFVIVSFLEAYALVTLHPIMFLLLLIELYLLRLPLPCLSLSDKCIFIFLALATCLLSLGDFDSFCSKCSKTGASMSLRLNVPLVGHRIV